MNIKLKRIITAFILTTIFYFITNFLNILWQFGIFVPHTGMLYVLGLLFGPYGALGSVLAITLFDIIEGNVPEMVIASPIIGFGVSYLAYKLWYSNFKGHELTKPRLNNLYNIIIFLSSIIICGLIYSVCLGFLSEFLFLPRGGQFLSIEYFMNFINIAFIFGIINIWIFKDRDLIDIPKKSKERGNNKVYQIILFSSIIPSLILIFGLVKNRYSQLALVILIMILLYAYLSRPVSEDINESTEVTTLEKIITIFLITTLIICVFGIIMSFIGYSNRFINLDVIDDYITFMPLLTITDMIILFYFIPGFLVLRYVEKKVMEPIASFSEVEGFIKENERIEAEGLLSVYSEYIDENDEIGKLARSYTNLINHNNNYIDNIHEIEGEKERIKAELDIATRIQASNLPTQALENDDFIVNGYSHPAKEVGGDFFDYFMLDEENLAIVIGDASGKGVPAALLSTITQVIIKQTLIHESNPAKVLNLVNNQLCEKNSEYMFITLWLGIYNMNTKKLSFSNAGHNPPLIEENNEVKILDIDPGVVLGILEDYEFIYEEIDLEQEIVLYTDGIVDAINENNERYGEYRLLNFFKNFDKEEPIIQILEDIHDFTRNEEQFDDMTLLYLKIK